MSTPLTLEFEQGLAIMTFNNPARGNVLDLAMARAFASAIEQVASHQGVRALLIDKDRKPKWSCQDLTDVPREEIESHFR